MKKANMLILLGFLSLSVIGSAKPQQTFEEKNYLIEMTQEKSELTSENNSSSIEENRKEEIAEIKPMRDLKKLLNEFNNNKMPNLVGLSLREIISVYPQTKFPKYKIIGNGSVAEQYPSPGEKLDKNTEVKIVLK